MLTSIEICAGAGGQALGLAMAGFCHIALVEYEKDLFPDAIRLIEEIRPDIGACHN